MSGDYQTSGAATIFIVDSRGVVYQAHVEPTPFFTGKETDLTTVPPSGYYDLRGIIYPALQGPVVFREAVSADEWLSQLSTPLRPKQHLLASAHQFLAYTPQISESIFYDKWGFALSEPLRSRKLAPAYHQSSVIDGDPIVSFGWMAGLSEPFPTKRRTRLGEIQSDLDPIVSFSWFNNLNQPPVLERRRVRLGEFSTDLDPIVSFGWFNNLSQPQLLAKIRVRLGEFTTDLDPIVTFGWMSRLGEPRFQPRARYLEDQPAYFFVETPPEEDIPAFDVPGSYIAQYITTSAY